MAKHLSRTQGVGKDQRRGIILGKTEGPGREEEEEEMKVEEEEEVEEEKEEGRLGRINTEQDKKPCCGHGQYEGLWVKAIN